MGYEYFDSYPPYYRPGKCIVEDKCIPDCFTKVEKFQQAEVKCAVPLSENICCYNELWMADFLAKQEFGEPITVTTTGSSMGITGTYSGAFNGCIKIATNSMPGCPQLILCIDICCIETVSRGLCLPEELVYGVSEI